jgi:hypothetical protein
MSEHFLVSESLKTSLTKETLYKNVNDENKTVPIVLEMRSDLNKIELDICTNDSILRKNISLSKIIFDEATYVFKAALNFKINRIFFNEAKSILYTIVIDEEKFWSNL